MAIHVEVVSSAGVIWKGEAAGINVPGSEGELGILGGHAPLLTVLKAGHVVIHPEDRSQDVILYVSGGILEVQPAIVTVLTDTALRAETIDEKAVLEAKAQAEAALKDRSGRMDYALVQVQIAEMAAQLRTLERLRGVRR